MPALARAVVPCFDQPDLKEVFSLHLDIPEDWVAVSDGGLRSETISEGRKRLAFNDTKPIPTYLFSFVAGRWQVAEETVDGLPMHFYYRETTPDKLAQIPEVFRQAASAVRWMEDYTGIPYPFEKYDFVAIPGYQFGGMEHPGAIQFNDKRIFLDPDPTMDNLLSRANLITHETAHMWFGDLVTMQWFDDVWTKEVFANWFAAQMTGPLFPDVDTALNDFKQFNIPAYEEDRTAGSNAVKQRLGNLADAGLIYGNIVYDKAPVVMRMLAEKMGRTSPPGAAVGFPRRACPSMRSMPRAGSRSATPGAAGWSGRRKSMSPASATPHSSTSPARVTASLSTIPCRWRT